MWKLAANLIGGVIVAWLLMISIGFLMVLQFPGAPPSRPVQTAVPIERVRPPPRVIPTTRCQSPCYYEK